MGDKEFQGNIKLKELKDYFIDNEITEIFKNISFERYHYLLLLLFNLKQL